MIVVDIETTGVDPQKHSIISIGAVEFENPDNEFYGECSIWDGAEITEEALEANGFSIEDVTDRTKQSLEILMRAFIDWTHTAANRTLAGRNVAEFDLQFLMTSAYKYSLNWDLAKRTIDDHALTYMHMVKRGLTPPEKNKRSDIDSNFTQNYVGIPEVPYPHNALTDAKWTAEAISRLLYDKSLFDSYKEYPIPWLTE